MNMSNESQRFRITNMDCPSEEGEIRRVLDGVDDIRGLQFDLGQRELVVTASGSAIQQALVAIRKAGFNPEPVQQTEASEASAPPVPSFWSSWGKLISALLLAIVAEGLSF